MTPEGWSGASGTSLELSASSLIRPERGSLLGFVVLSLGAARLVESEGRQEGDF